MISAIQIIAERKILEAIREGRLNMGSWRGKPMPREDNSFVPADLRMAYKILKNAGFVPPEVETRKEICRLEELIAQTEDEHTRVKQLSKLNYLTFKLNNMRQKPLNLEEHERYYRKVAEKITVSKKGKNGP